MRLIALASLLISVAMVGLLLLVAEASADWTNADSAITSDVASTAAGLSQGFVEANPLALPLLPVRYAANIYAQGAETDPAWCRNILSANASVGWAAAASNIVTLLVPAALPLSFAAFVYVAHGQGNKEWYGEALDKCYGDRIQRVVIEIPENFQFRDLSPQEMKEFDRVAGWFALNHMIGTQPVNGRKLMQVKLIVPEAEALAVAEQYGWAWRIMGSTTGTLHPDVARYVKPEIYGRLATADDMKTLDVIW